jgi:hypothetical protein
VGEENMKIFDNCCVTTWDRFTDPGDYPSNAGSSPLPPGPWTPEEVEGYAIFVFDPDEEKELLELLSTSKDISSEDFVHDLILCEIDFNYDVRCTKVDIRILRIGGNNYFLVIPIEAKIEDSEVSIANGKEDDIIAKATEILRRKYNAQN